MDPSGFTKLLSNLKPAGSNVLLTILALGGLWVVGKGVELVSMTPPRDGFGAGLIGIGSLIIVGVFVGFWRSSKVQDLKGGELALESDKEGKVKLTADTSILADLDQFRAISDLVSTVAHREPLPPPTGVLDEQLNPVPNTAQAAQAKVDEVNNIGQQLCNAVLAALNISKPEVTVMEGGSQPIAPAFAPPEETRGVQSPGAGPLAPSADPARVAPGS